MRITRPKAAKNEIITNITPAAVNITRDCTTSRLDNKAAENKNITTKDIAMRVVPLRVNSFNKRPVDPVTPESSNKPTNSTSPALLSQPLDSYFQNLL
jgi:hypothetical protein